MNKLILHIGPGKCGSSSIQDFFLKHKNLCNEKVFFTFLNSKKIDEINLDEPTKECSKYFNQLIKTSIKMNSTIILSHEFLFNKPNAIKNICILASKISDIAEIQIIGYSRKQSDFMVSAYSQWLFRAPERIKEVKTAIMNIGINPIHFSGLEKQLIGSIVNDFYSARQLSDDTILDWNKQYNKIKELTSPYGAKVKCGTLPNKKFKKNLIEDFCFKTGLTLKSEAKEVTNIKSNLKFNKELIEAVNITADLGLNVPSPHDYNKLFTSKVLITNQINPLDESLVLFLKEYIDGYFLESNHEFCNTYNLNANYFDASKKHSKEELLNAVKAEQEDRIKSGKMVNRYRDLIAIITESLYHNYKKETKKKLPVQFLKKILNK